MKHKNSILAVGSVAFDSLQTPAGQAERVLGGSANYFSVAASFYSPVQIIGVVGDDFPKSHLDWLAARHIDVSGVQQVPGKTFHWRGSYDTNLNEAKTLETALNVFEHFTPQLSATHKNSKVLFLANIDPVLQQSVLDQAGTHDLVACDTMNFWLSSKLDEVKKTLRRVDLLSINEGEAYLLAQTRNVAQAAATIRAMGPSIVIIKRGEYGALLFTPNHVFAAPAFTVDRVIDPTGAGDTFAGALMGYLAEQGFTRRWITEDPARAETTLRQAVLAGCVMASFTVEDFSLHRLMRLESHELVERKAKMMKMISPEAP